MSGPDFTTFGWNEGLVRLPQLGVRNLTSFVSFACSTTRVSMDTAFFSQSRERAEPSHACDCRFRIWKIASTRVAYLES